MPKKIFVALLITAAIFVGIFKLIPLQPVLSSAQAQPSEQLESASVLTMLNDVRSSAVPVDSSLQHDPDLQAWADDQITSADSKSPNLSAEQILNNLQTQVEGVAAASAGVFRAPYRAEAFRTEFAGWKELKDPTYTHSAVVLRPYADKNLVDVWAVLVQRLPKFEPNLLAKGLQQFHHICARCERPYNGQFYGGDRILLLQCPHCNTNYDILAVDTADHYARANTFLSRIAPPAAFRRNMSPYEEMITLWHGVLDHCIYETDYDVANSERAKDAWQTSAETLQQRSGDCEDTSILLADWLMSRGIKARVVIGETDDSEGHAWCIARIDGNVFLLETTGEKEDLPRDPPLAKQSTEKYRPEYLFDRTHLYFFNGEPGQGAGDCWSSFAWKAVDYSSSAPLAEEPSPVAAPWFPSITASFAGNIVPAVSGEAKEVAGAISETAVSSSDCGQGSHFSKGCTSAWKRGR